MTSRDLRLHTAITVLTLACLTIGCAKTMVSERQIGAENEPLPKPNRIIVYDFAATPEDVPVDDPLAGHYAKPARAQTADEVSLGKQLSTEIAGQLVQKILKLGLPAERSGTGPPPGSGDLIIKGAFVSIDKGDRLKRMLIGFGAGAGELKTFVEIYQITPEGPRPLVSEEIKAMGGKMPGMLFTIVAAVAAGPAGLSVAPAVTTGPAGAIGEATASSGSVNLAKEMGPESIGAAAKNTVKEIVKALTHIFARHGWI